MHYAKKTSHLHDTLNLFFKFRCARTFQKVVRLKTEIPKAIETLKALRGETWGGGTSTVVLLTSKYGW